jgi:hypothetical protein
MPHIKGWISRRKQKYVKSLAHGNGTRLQKSSSQAVTKKSTTSSMHVKWGAVKATQGANNTDKSQGQYWELYRKTGLERFSRQLQQPSTGNKPVLIARLMKLNGKKSIVASDKKGVKNPSQRETPPTKQLKMSPTTVAHVQSVATRAKQVR